MNIRKANCGLLSTLCIAVCFLITSCNKEHLEGPNETSLKDPHAVELDLNALPEVVLLNGQKMLKFDNIDHFETTLKSISKMQGIMLDNWEKRLGFISMRNEFERIEDQYQRITSQEELDQFRDENRLKVRFLEDGDLEMRVDMYHIGSLINSNGIVQLGDMIQQFFNDRSITIIDGDFTKLERAQTLEESDLENGIRIDPIITTVINARSDGPVELDCTSDWDDEDDRVRMSLKLTQRTIPDCTPVVSITCPLPGQTGSCRTTVSCNPNGLFRVICNVELKIRSQHQGFLNIPFGRNADITASFGFNVAEFTNGMPVQNHWEPVNESVSDEKRLVKTYLIEDMRNLPAGTLSSYCFAGTHVAGTIDGGTNCHVWN